MFGFDNTSLPQHAVRYFEFPNKYARVCGNISVANELIPYFSCDANNIGGTLHKFDIWWMISHNVSTNEFVGAFPFNHHPNQQWPRINNAGYQWNFIIYQANAPFRANKSHAQMDMAAVVVKSLLLWNSKQQTYDQQCVTHKPKWLGLEVIANVLYIDFVLQLFVCHEFTARINYCDYERSI